MKDPFEKLKNELEKTTKSKIPTMQVLEGDRFLFKVLAKEHIRKKNGKPALILVIEARNFVDGKISKETTVWKIWERHWISDKYVIGDCYAAIGIRNGNYVNIATSNLKSEHAQAMGFPQGW